MTRPPGVHTKGWAKGYRAADSLGIDLRCARCGESKPVEAFRLLRHGSRASYCNPCQVAATRAWRAENREEINARRRAAYVPASRR
jgi:hypothetical protein